MKKLVVFLGLILIITGCGNKGKEDVISTFEHKVTNSKSYVLKGNMEILSNEETYTYSLEVNFLADAFYKVKLVNQTNNHEQIILKNNDGVYVITPTLNKSFKFQSEWPDSSSQAYILSSLLKDIKNDADNTVEKQDKNYVVKAKVNYPNNAALSYEKIYFDEDMNLEKVEIYDNNDTLIIKMVFSSINLKANLKDSDFKIEDLIKTDCDDEACKEEKKTCENEECDKKTSNIIDDIIYPLYIPSETYLSNSEKIDTDEGNRVILTFAGDKNFVLIEEVANIASDFEIIPVYGDPVMLSDTIAAKSANSMYWTSNNVSYYLTSNDLSTNEMVTIAESLGNAKVVSQIEGGK